MDIKLLTQVEKESIGERQPLPEKYLRLSDDEMDERIAAAEADARRPRRHPGPSLSARRGHQVRRLHRRLAEAVARGREQGHARSSSSSAASTSWRRAPTFSARRIRKSSCPTSPPAAPWPTWRPPTSSRLPGASSQQMGVRTDAIENGRAGIIPVTYINSSAAIKAFVGAHGGIVCTSTNAAAVMKWAWERGEKLLMLPDQHLGRNTALEDGRAARPDGRVGPERDVGRPRARAGEEREADPVEGALLGPHTLHDATDRRLPQEVSGRQGHRASRVHARGRPGGRRKRIHRTNHQRGQEQPGGQRRGPSRRKSTSSTA